MEIFIILALTILNGVFSMSEISIISARKSRLQSEAKRGSKGAKIALDTSNSPNRFLSTVQIGITLIGILLGIYSGDNITENLQKHIEDIPYLAPYAKSIAYVLVLIILTFLSLVLGELFPKRVGLSYPESIAKMVAGPMRVLSTITNPFVWLLTFTTDLLVKLFRITPSSESKVTEEEIKAIIQEGTEGGEINEIEQDIVERVFDLGDRNVSSLMTHRGDLVFLNINDNAISVKEKVEKEMHSLYPVYDEAKEKLTGIVFLKELFKHISYDNFNLSEYIQSPQYISETLSVYEALKKFKDTGIHYGVVVDEFGEVQGIVTLNDLLEALVGNAEDFYADDYTFLEREDGSWLVDGQYSFHDFLKKFNLDELSNEYNFNTIGGLILEELKEVPVVGQKVVWNNFEFDIVDMDGARIDKIIIKSIENND